MNPSPRRRVGRLPRAQRVASHAILAVCALSGLAFFVVHDLRTSLFDLPAHTFLVWHGMSAAFALLVFGAVLPVHVRAAWTVRRNRGSGVAMIAAMSVLMLSGLLLYYGNEDARDATVLAHWIVGFASCAVFPLHLLLGRRAAATTACMTQDAGPLRTAPDGSLAAVRASTGMERGTKGRTA